MVEAVVGGVVGAMLGVGAGIVMIAYLLHRVPLIGDTVEAGDVVEVGVVVGVGVLSHFLTVGIISLILLLLQVNPKDPHFVYETLGIQIHIHISLCFSMISSFKHIVNQTNLYVRQRPYHRANYQWHDTSVDEIQVIFGYFYCNRLRCHYPT